MLYDMILFFYSLANEIWSDALPIIDIHEFYTVLFANSGFQLVSFSLLMEAVNSAKVFDWFKVLLSLILYSSF